MSLETLGRKFARLTTNAVVRRPGLWRLFRGLMRRQFDTIAPRWETFRMPDSLAPFEAALDAVDPAPKHALDLGTGTGAAARAIAARFPDAQVVGASTLPYEKGAFDLVTHSNMIPFFDEVDRVLAPGGRTVFAFSGGAGTPIYVPPERLRVELERRGFTEFAEFAAGRGTAFLARKGGQG
jgi:SAM-dependent methyltransferase